MNWEFLGSVIGTIPIILTCLLKAVSAAHSALKVKLLWSRLEEDKKAAAIPAQQQKIGDYQNCLQEPLSNFRKAVFAFIFIGIIAVLLLWPSWSASKRIDNLNTRVTELESKSRTLESEVQRLNAINKNQKKELGKTLIAFADEYRARLKSAQDAVDQYVAFDTAPNRKELGDDFERRKMQRFDDMKAKIQALINHIHGWEPLLEPLQKLMNGQVRVLEEATIGNDERDMLQSFKTLSENAVGYIERLKQALDRTIQNAPSG